MIVPRREQLWRYSRILPDGGGAAIDVKRESLGFCENAESVYIQAISKKIKTGNTHILAPELLSVSLCFRESISGDFQFINTQLLGYVRNYSEDGKAIVMDYGYPQYIGLLLSYSSRQKLWFSGRFLEREKFLNIIQKKYQFLLKSNIVSELTTALSWQG